VLTLEKKDISVCNRMHTASEATQSARRNVVKLSSQFQIL